MDVVNPTKQKVLVTIEQVKAGDVIYLSTKADATPYSVLDVGNPFILIENLKSHFCNLFRPTQIYKEI